MANRSSSNNNIGVSRKRASYHRRYAAWDGVHDMMMPFSIVDFPPTIFVFVLCVCVPVCACMGICGTTRRNMYIFTDGAYFIT